MRKIHLYGRLKKKFGAMFELEVATAAEAIRAIGGQIPGFYEELKKGSYEVIRGDRKSGSHLTVDDVKEFHLSKDPLHIVPVTKGSKNGGGVLKVILGVALLGAAIFLSGGLLATPLMATGLLSGITYGNLALMGLGLALAGTSQLLTPDKKADTNSENQASFSINGPGNTIEQGVPMPLVYGRDVMVGSVLISAGLDVEPIPVGWDPLNGQVLPYGIFN